MRYKWLLFDADDTLFDYPKAENSALRNTFEHFGRTYHPNILQIYHRINRQLWDEFERGTISAEMLRWKRFQLLFDKMEDSFDPEEFSRHYLENLAQASDLIPGAMETLLALSGRYRMGLVTNGLSEVQRPRLERAGIGRFFERIFISEELGAPKPEVEFFEAVFHEIEEPSKSQVLIIGDSLSSDMRGGIRFGIDTCWFNPHGETSDLPVTHVIKTLGELLDWL